MPAVQPRLALHDFSDDLRTANDGAIVGRNSVDIAFAPNVTPITFNDPPSPIVDVHHLESSLFPPSVSNDCPAPRRSGHNKRKPENHIPRPPNAFILFRSAFIKNQHVSTKVETSHSTLSKIIGLTWQNLPNEERQIWHQKAKLALKDHKRRFPDYAFRPVHGKKRADKRKMREVGPKDVKRCEKIAELLVGGKIGQELDAALEEFDKNHAPEVVTRFEAPITAQTFEDGPSTTMMAERKMRTGSRKPSPFTPASPASPASLYFPLTMQEQMQDISSDALFNWASLDQYPYPQSEHSFDCPSFNFATIPTPEPSLDYHEVPCSSIATQTAVEMYAPSQSTDYQPPQLSIDTSLMPDAECWTRDSSPSTATCNSMPLTPYIDSPSLNLYDDPYAVDAYPQPHFQGSSQLDLFLDASNGPFIGYDDTVYTHQPHPQGHLPPPPIMSDYLHGIEQAQKCQTYATEVEYLPSLAGVQYSL